MHWAAHKHTAAEVIYQRADADKDNMGLTAWAGKEIKRSDVEIAKNYLSRNFLSLGITLLFHIHKGIIGCRQALDFLAFRYFL